MNIQTVADNLRNTIAGKEAYLTSITEDIALLTKDRKLVASEGEIMALRATKEFLKININELKVILFDVEQCVAKDVEQSWRDNPDRSGGQFTQDEIDNAGRWQ